MNSLFETAQSAPALPARTNVVRALRHRLATIALNPELLRTIQLARQRRAAPMPREFGGAMYETGAPPAKPIPRNAMLLSFKIPESPYSDELMERLHKIFEVIEGVDAVLTIFEAEVITLLGATAAAGLGLVLGVAAPIAALLGTFLAIGSAYAAARAKIARERLRFGFALGVVMGADGRAWKYAKGMFWEWTPESNPADQEAGRIAQRMFNTGLVAGFIQGRKLSKAQRSFFWRSLGRTMSAGDKAQFGGDSKLWPERLWIDWYIWAGAGFLKLYAKD